jgi:hypothetical protein
VSCLAFGCCVASFGDSCHRFGLHVASYSTRMPCGLSSGTAPLAAARMAPLSALAGWSLWLGRWRGVRPAATSLAGRPASGDLGPKEGVRNGRQVPSMPVASRSAVPAGIAASSGPAGMAVLQCASGQESGVHARRGRPGDRARFQPP